MTTLVAPTALFPVTALQPLFTLSAGEHWSVTLLFVNGQYLLECSDTARLNREFESPLGECILPENTRFALLERDQVLALATKLLNAPGLRTLAIGTLEYGQGHTYHEMSLAEAKHCFVSLLRYALGLSQAPIAR